MFEIDKFEHFVNEFNKAYENGEDFCIYGSEVDMLNEILKFIKHVEKNFK